MKPDIHPKYYEVKVTCSCGTIWKIKSTRSSDFTVEICSNCHPFYTGKERTMESADRVERFRRKYGQTTS